MPKRLLIKDYAEFFDIHRNKVAAVLNDYSYNIRVPHHAIAATLVIAHLYGYDVEDLKVEKGKEFNLSIEDASEDIESPAGITWKKVYSINPTELNFTNAVVTSIANGNALYKCKDWNYSRQECFGSWKKIKDIDR